MLDRVLREKIRNIRNLLDAVDPFEAERVEKVKADHRFVNQPRRCGIRVKSLRTGIDLLYRKLDVNEEKTRLAHHLDYFEETMNDRQSQGKKLGFIAQEIGREINTLGSKSNQSEMQRIVVRMKDELEQIKEQVLNVL